MKDAFVRFRYGDGFSHSRALALQLVLSLIPLGIAFIGLSSTDPAPSGWRRCCARCCCGSRRAAPTSWSARPWSRTRQRPGTAVSWRCGSASGSALLALTTVDGPGRARRQPDLRHPARPAGAAQVRPGRADGLHGRAAVAGRVPGDRRRRHGRRRAGADLRLGRHAAAGLDLRALPGRRPAGARRVHDAHRAVAAPAAAGLVLDRDRRRRGTDAVARSSPTRCRCTCRPAGRSARRTGRSPG